MEPPVEIFSGQSMLMQGTQLNSFRDLEDKYINTSVSADHISAYNGTANPEMDRDFTTAEIRVAIDRMRRGTAPGPDQITTTLMANLSDDMLELFADQINKYWQEGMLPQEWKSAEIVFIPKPGKSINIDNLRPISLTSCAGKVMEKALQIRITEYMEANDLFPHTMFGFRAHLSAQDVLFQLKYDIIDRPSGATQQERAILAIDFQGAFDNVRHSAILNNLARIGIGQRTYDYVRDFLHNRHVTIRAGDTKSAPITMGDSGTPQGAVISPLLFNIALLDLPRALKRDTQNQARSIRR